MENPVKKALLFGASGFIGSYLLRALLEDPGYAQVIAVVRKKPAVEHLKLKTVVADRDSLPHIQEALEADDVFISLGTTKKKTPDQAEYYRIDHDYPVLAARIAREQGAGSVFLVSAVGANAQSGIFYLRTKGETERDIIALDFEHTCIFRPSMIMGEREEHRPTEKALIALWFLLSPIFAGGLAKYKGMEAKDIATAMVNAAKKPEEKVAILGWPEINALLRR